MTSAETETAFSACPDCPHFLALPSDQLSHALDFGQPEGQQKGKPEDEEKLHQRVDQWEPLVECLVGKYGTDQDLKQEKMQNIDAERLLRQC